MTQPEAEPEDLSPELAREQLALFAENFHRFVLEAIPRLEAAFSEDTLEELLDLALHYQKAFENFSRYDDLLALQYLHTARRLVGTIARLLGRTS